MVMAFGRCGRYGRWRNRSFSKVQSQKKALSLCASTNSSATAAAAAEAAAPVQIQSSPPPIRVSLTETAGRGVFATRPIGAGELIHTAKPVVSHPSISGLHSVCYFCLKKLPHLSHSQPPATRFCSPECKQQSQAFYEVESQADWSAFDGYCRVCGLKYPLMVRRLACMVISGTVPVDSLDILQPASLSTAMKSEIQQEFEMLRSAFSKANVADRQISFLNSEWYTSVLARIRINAFRVELVGGSYGELFSSAAASVQAEASVGNAIYILPSFYNHDCDPNTHIVWIENVNARLKALREIEAGFMESERQYIMVYRPDTLSIACRSNLHLLRSEPMFINQVASCMTVQLVCNDPNETC